MAKPKGTRNKSTIKKQKKAPERLESVLAAKIRLTDELSNTEEHILVEQQRVKEIKKQLRILNREITTWEKAIAEKEEREKKAAVMEKIQETVDKLVENGVCADEIIRRLGYDSEITSNGSSAYEAIQESI